MYAHCITGVTRAPLVGAMLCARLHTEEFGKAVDRVCRLRNTQLRKSVNSLGGEWVQAVAKTPIMVWPEPQVFTAAYGV